MAEVSSAPKDPERGENVAAAAGASALPRSSTVPANSSNTSNFSPAPLRSSLSSPIGGMLRCLHPVAIGILSYPRPPIATTGMSH